MNNDTIQQKYPMMWLHRLDHNLSRAPTTRAAHHAKMTVVYDRLTVMCPCRSPDFIFTIFCYTNMCSAVLNPKFTVSDLFVFN